MPPILLPFIIVMPAIAYSLISLWCAIKYFKGQGARGKGQGVDSDLSLPLAPCPLPLNISILKPVKGLDAGSYDNFASFCRQQYDGRQQIVFAVASADDAVIPVIRQLIADFPAHDISLVVNPAIHGPNYKVSNLIHAFSAAKYDIIIVCDSDIRVTPHYLKSVSGHFDDPKTGLVTSLYRTSTVHGIATAMEATGFTAEMIPNVMVARQLEGLTFALGASMAARRAALLSIGGFEALADYLADDYQLGNKIHRAGWRIALDDCYVESMLKPENLQTVVSRQLRWSRTMRVSRPGGYLASGVTLPFPAALLAVAVAPSVVSAVAAPALLYLVRLTIATQFSRRFVGDYLLPRWLWLIPFRDAVAFFTWVSSFLGDQVEWRGNRFRLMKGGKLKEIV